MSKATKRPWSVATCVDGVYAGKKCLVMSPGGEILGPRQIGRKTVSTREIVADAELIVRAVNAHDEMVAALDSCLRWIQAMEDGSKPMWNPIPDAQAALKKAKEGQ